LNFSEVPIVVGVAEVAVVLDSIAVVAITAYSTAFAEFVFLLVALPVVVELETVALIFVVMFGFVVVVVVVVAEFAEEMLLMLLLFGFDCVAPFGSCGQYF
jgi:hypothetical protein